MATEGRKIPLKGPLQTSPKRTVDLLVTRLRHQETLSIVLLELVHVRRLWKLFRIRLDTQNVRTYSLDPLREAPHPDNHLKSDCGMFVGS